MKELFCDLGILGAYFAVLAAVALTLRKLIRIPDELFRKILHCILLGSLPVFVFGFDTWWRAAAASVVFAVVVYPILAWFERFRGYSELTTERKKGELKESLAARELELHIDPSVREYLVNKAFSVTYGARNLRREIQRSLEDPISEKIIDSFEHPISSIFITVEADEIRVEAK